MSTFLLLLGSDDLCHAGIYMTSCMYHIIRGDNFVLVVCVHLPDMSI